LRSWLFWLFLHNRSFLLNCSPFVFLCGYLLALVLAFVLALVLDRRGTEGNFSALICGN
jgi:hypothetical protein